MIALGRIIPEIIKFLRQTLPKYPIYSHVPVEAGYPLIRLGLITQEPWYILGNSNSCTLELQLEIWSNHTSNKPCILIADKVGEEIMQRALTLPYYRIINSVIKSRQIVQAQQQGLWCGTLVWQLWVEKLG